MILFLFLGIITNRRADMKHYFYILLLIPLLFFPERPANSATNDAPDVVIDRFDPEDWKGKPYLIDFFASWCPPCRLEHEQLMNLARRGVNIVGIAHKNRGASVQNYLSQQGSPFSHVSYDTRGNGIAVWGVTGLPESFIIDKKGTILFHQKGPLTAEVIRDKILPLWHRIQ